MMASSPSSRAVCTRQRNNHTRVYVAIITIILLNLSISVQSSIHGVHESLTARVGDTVNIHFENCGLPRPSCTMEQSFKLSAPNPTCTVDRYRHCEVVSAPDDDPIRQDLDSGCELCMLVVHGVTQRDAGPYAICQTSGACMSSSWRKISTLEFVSGNEEPSTPTYMSTKVSTKPTTEKKETAPLTTKAVEPYPILSTTYTEKVGSNDHHLNEKHEHPGKCCTTRNIILTVFIVVIALVALIIWVIRWVRKRRNRSKSHDHECYDHEGPPMGYPQPVVGNGFAVHGDSEDDATETTSIVNAGSNLATDG